MAKLTDDFAKKILRFEGGYVNDPLDAGGCTNMGVTLETWKESGYDKDGDGVITCEDIKLLEFDDFKIILDLFWDSVGADGINNQSLAEIITDFAWGSGQSIASKKIQVLVDANPDGDIGKLTLAAINNFADQQLLFDKYKEARLQYIDAIVANHPDQVRFEKGWKNRINEYVYSENEVAL